MTNREPWRVSTKNGLDSCIVQTLLRPLVLGRAHLTNPSVLKKGQYRKEKAQNANQDE